MDRILVVKTHSVIDLITNSSTELFVSHCGKSIEIIQEILESAYAGFVIAHNAVSEYKITGEFSSAAKVETVREMLLNDEWRDGNNVEEDLKYFNHSWGVSLNLDDIVVCGTSDNSIPYEFFTFIEDLLETSSIHLG